MKEFYFGKIWCILGFIYVAIVFYFSLVPFPEKVPVIPHLDKMLHFLIYAFLGGWFQQLFIKKFGIKILVSLFFMGVLIEILQGFSGYRSFEFMDIVANSVGVLVGIKFVIRFFPDVLIKIDLWFFKHLQNR